MTEMNYIDWADLTDAYGSASDIPVLLNQIKESPEPWMKLWSRLYHQGTISTASYAAVPVIVQTLNEVAIAGYFLQAVSMQLFIRIANAFARIDRNRLHLAVGCVAFVITLTGGSCLVRDLLHILPTGNCWKKEQTKRDIDVLEACAYDKAHVSHGHHRFLQSLENHSARHSP